jgi:hypothetical protein
MAQAIRDSQRRAELRPFLISLQAHISASPAESLVSANPSGEYETDDRRCQHHKDASAEVE